MSLGFYESRVFPWLNDRLNADPALEQIRAEALRGARGREVEIGFGSGLNLAHYPSAVQSLVAVEPSEGMTPYHYFADKAELLSALWQHVLKDQYAAMSEAIEAHGRRRR